MYPRLYMHMLPLCLTDLSSFAARCLRAWTSATKLARACVPSATTPDSTPVSAYPLCERMSVRAPRRPRSTDILAPPPRLGLLLRPRQLLPTTSPLLARRVLG
ncbi:hypothetical protein C8J57DRAFT_1274833 [Mycena rebaudengoi]|nr:hypothetical protein C8J57DRAFT_1274833 [Mycena rebaudengoi]